MINDSKLPSEEERQLLLVQAKQQLDQQAADLPASTLAALDNARRKAVGQSEQQRGWDRRWNKWAYVPALAACLLVAVLWIDTPLDAGRQVIDTAAEPTDIEMTLAEEDFDILQQELEFYLWLEQQPVSG
jgi:hypothetical protein